MKEEKPLRILLAEDLPTDAELAEKEIRKGGIEFTLRRVDTKEAFLKALEEFQPDLIVSDYKMPSFDGMQALKLSLEHNSAIPVIILTGSMNEETAVECMKAGATNYVIKEHIARLPFAVKEALEQKKMRSAKDKAERALRESEEKYRLLAESSPEMIHLIGKDGRVLYVNSIAASQLHAKPLELVGKHLTEIFPPDLAHLNLESIQRVIDTKEASLRETVQKFPSGDIWIEARLSPVIDKSGEVFAVLGLSSNITERKRVEQQIDALSRFPAENPNPILRVEQNGQIIYANLASEALLRLWNCTVGEYLPPVWQEQVVNAARSNTRTTVEVECEEWVYSIMIVPIPGLGYVNLYGRDITEYKRAEKQITLLAHTVKSIIECVSITDMNNKILFVNEAFLTTYGYDEREILGKDISIVRLPSDSPEVLRGIQEATLGGGWHGEFMNRTKNGREFPVSLSTSTVRDDTGQAVGLVGVATDITERRQVEEALRYEKALLDALMNNIPDSIYFKDRQCRLVRINRKMMQDLKLDDMSQAIGKTDVELFGEEFGRKTLSSDESLITMGKPIVGLTESRQLENGQLNWASTTKVPLRDDSGEIVGLVGITREINELMKAHEEREHERNLLRTLIDNLPDNIYIKDTESRFVVGNRAVVRQLGFAAEKDLIGKTDFDLFPRELAARYHAVEQAIIQSGKGIYDDEAPAVDANKEEKDRWVSTTKVPLRDAQGQIMGIVGIGRYITERRRAEEKLGKSEEKYRGIFENVQDVYYETTIEGTILEVSPSIEIISNGQYHRDDLIGKPMSDFYSVAGGRQAFLAILRDRGSISDHEIMLKKRDGSQVPCSISAKIQFDAQGTPFKIIGSLRDITERKSAEETIRESEERFRMVFENVFDGISIYSEDPDPSKRRLIECNDRYAVMAGRSREELLQLGSTQGLQITLEDTANRNRLDSLEGGTEYRGSFSWNRPDGKDNIVEYVGVPITWRGKSHSIGIDRNITERKHAEEALAVERNLLRTLIDNLPDRIFIKDMDSRFLLNNVAHIRALGAHSQEEVTGKTDYDYCSRDLADRHIADDRNVIETGQPSINREEPTILESGEGGWLLANKVPVRDPEGKIVGLVGISRDITNAKKAEEALKKSEEQYRQFFEDDLTGDYVSTPEGKILSCNRAFARIYGFASVEEALKADTHSLYAEPEEREIFLRLLKEHKKLEYYESEYLRRDGKRVYCVENAVGIFDQQDNLVQFWGYIFDDTKRKTLERQLIQAQKLESLGTLASGIAHDFNNILGIILGYTTLLTRQEANTEDFKNSADAVIRASQRGAALVKQLLTFARKVDVQLQPVRLNDVVNEISKLLSETMAKTVEISLHLEEDLPTITGDPTQIHQVLLNLCVNARDAMTKGGTIGITTCCQQGETVRAKFPRAVARMYVVLRVTDTGIGMDKITQSRIFEPFFTTKGVGKGTGLGLSVVFGIIESHNGFVEVESELGKGTTFHLYFPVLQIVEIEQAKAEIQPVIQGGKETILVVEDEEMLTRLLRTSLQTAGYTVLIAVDGQEAVDLFDQYQDEIQLVLSDVGLPKLAGYDVFRKMKRMKPNLKFILASGFIEPQQKSEIFKEGVKDFIQKPYSVYEVLKAIRSTLDQK